MCKTLYDKNQIDQRENGMKNNIKCLCIWKLNDSLNQMGVF